MKCQSCDAPMLWAVTTKGARMPLDYEPAPGGTVWIKPGDGYARVLDEAQLARAVAAGEPLFMPHHATCPGAGRHRVSRAQGSLF